MDDDFSSPMIWQPVSTPFGPIVSVVPGPRVIVHFSRELSISI
jgi:hypothetical protein